MSSCLATILRCVLDAALCALEYEDQNEIPRAIDSYMLARSELSYAMDSFIHSTGHQLIREACKGMIATYEKRITELRRPTPQIQGKEVGGGHEDIVIQCKKEVEGNLDDVAGMTCLKTQLRESILLPLRFPALFTGIRRPPCNFLLHGPPGTGKTLLVEKVAAESGVHLLELSPSTVMSKWSGESERTIRDVFKAAKAIQPTIIFMDEIDSLAPRRGGQDDNISRRVLTELLIQMTGVKAEDKVYVFGATNRLQDCDEALLRRFDRRIYTPLPDKDCRMMFLKMMIAKPEVASNLKESEIRELAEETRGYTGSDLALVCREAALMPVRDFLETMQITEAGGNLSCQGKEGLRLICKRDFLIALKNVPPSFQRRETVRTPEE